ncbi:hypothetical protein PS880_06214 [Pseudomonas fluorescens]|uniref:Uncharacterized protein n=1 Tax=Pseudomonas fluorescens TaxID=294 RepID=A0A5E7QPP1_PSEFL|nr:hypothetical protein PS880_06214 [Pseudomonas fluorescens]
MRAALTAQCSALVEQGLRHGGLQRATGDDAAEVAQVLRTQADIARAVAAVVGIDPGFDDTVVGQLATTAQVDAVAGRETSLVAQAARRLDVERGAGVDRTLGVEAGGVDVDRARRRGLGQAQVAVGINLDVTATRCQITGQAHADASFGADQANGVGVHAAQCAGVDGQLRGYTAIRSPRGGGQGFGVDVVASGDDRQIIRLQLGVDLRTAGDDFKTVEVAGVQAGSVNRHAAAVDLVMVESAHAIQHRLTGGQGHARGVDETAAVARNPIRIRDDHSCRLSRDFRIAVELARATAINLIQNYLRGGPVKVRVAQNDPTQLRRLGAHRGVVENDPVGADVIVLELIVRKARVIGRSDLDNRNAITGHPEAAPRRTDHDAVSLCPHRLPEHDVR